MEDLDQQMRRRWHESRQRSRERRRLAARRRQVSAGRRRGGLALAIALAVALVASLTLAGSADDDGAGQAERSTLASSGPNAGEASGAASKAARAVPTAAGLRDAWRYARRRGGQVSIAVVDTKGRLRQRDGSRSYVSASVVKSMLLAAELRRLDRSSLPLDAGTQGLLKAMVTSSDNDAADAIYSRVGDTGLVEVAKAVGMRRFTVAGYWGNAQVTAADMARLFSRLGPRRAARAPAGGAGAAGGDRARPALGRAGGGEGVDGSLQGRLADHRSRSARTPGCPAAPGRSQPWPLRSSPTRSPRRPTGERPCFGVTARLLPVR